MIKSIKIGGHKVKIIMFDSFSSSGSEVGLCFPSTNIIKLAKNFEGSKLHNDVICENILHEVLHFIDYVYCGYIFEEKTIKDLGKYLYYVFSNSDILNFTKTVDILGFKYKIEYDYMFSETTESFAVDINYSTQVISVSGKTSSNDNCCGGYVLTRLLIGILTILNSEYIDSDKFRDNSSTFAQGIYQVLVDNKGFKDLFKWGK